MGAPIAHDNELSAAKRRAEPAICISKATGAYVPIGRAWRLLIW